LVDTSILSEEVFMGRRPFRKRQHTPGFKVEAVRLMNERLAAGLTLQRVSEELEIHPDQLRGWAHEVNAAPKDASPEQIFPGHGRRRQYSRLSPAGESVVTESPEDELRRLRRENERLRLERDFLKKAAAFFAKESR
jgi:transposase